MNGIDGRDAATIQKFLTEDAAVSHRRHENDVLSGFWHKKFVVDRKSVGKDEYGMGGEILAQHRFPKGGDCRIGR